MDATGGWGHPGIGGGDQETVPNFILICGGDVTALGGIYGAGIGGNLYGNIFNVTI